MRASFMLMTSMAIGFVLASGGNAQTTPGTDKKECFNPEKINWVFPGDFESALQRAKEENRVLIMKGLGFGLDELGATCATKGCW